MKKIFLNNSARTFFAGFAFFTLAASFATAKDWSELLKQAEANTGFQKTDFSANYKIVQKKPGSNSSSTEARLFRRDATKQWTILVDGPAREKGKGYLQTDGIVWFYDPADHRFTSTSAGDKFQNTNATTADFAPQPYYSSYNIEKTEEVKLGKLDCVLFTLAIKKGEKNLVYPRLKLWVTKSDGLPRMKEDYSATGEKMRTTVIGGYQVVEASTGTYSVPKTMTIQDEIKKAVIDGKTQWERTMVAIQNPSFVKVGDNIYTKPYLETNSSR